MNKEEWLRQENEKLLAIAIQAKKLLLSDEITDATPELMSLCDLVERYETEKGELPPKFKPYGKKPWYAGFDEKGQVASLSEIVELSDNKSVE
jgi:hypothetical protein